MADMEPEVGTPPQRQRWATKGVVAGCIGLVVLFAVAQSPFTRADKSRQLSEIVVTPPREECAKTTDDCYAQRCCQLIDIVDAPPHEERRRPARSGAKTIDD